MICQNVMTQNCEVVMEWDNILPWHENSKILTNIFMKHWQHCFKVKLDHPNKIFEHFSLFPLLKSLPRWDVNHMECHLVAMKICHLNKKSRKELKRSQVLWQGLNELQRSSALVSRIYKRKSSHISSTQKCRSIP